MRKFEFYGSYIDYDILTLSTAITTRQRIRIISSNNSNVVEPIYIDWGDGTGWHKYTGGGYADYTYSTPYVGDIRVRTESNDINNIYYVRIEDNFSNWNFDLSVLHNISKLNVLVFGWPGYPDTFIGANKIHGSINGFNTIFEQFLIHGEGYITGDIANIKVNTTSYTLGSLSFIGPNQQLTYSTRTWPSIPGNGGIYTYFNINLGSGKLSQTDIDQLLVDLSLSTASGSGSRIIYLNGNNAVPSSVGMNAISILASRGFTIIYNS